MIKKTKKITITDLSTTVDKLAFSVDKLSLSMRKEFKGVQNLIKEEIDGLAISTAKGFESIDRKLDQHDKIFESMIKELSSIHEDNKYFRQSISTLNINDFSCDKKIENLTIRVEKLETK